MPIIVFEGGVAKVVGATPRALPEENAARVVRPINLLAGADWQTLAQVWRRPRELSALPSPY